MVTEDATRLHAGREWRSPRTGAVARIVEMNGRAVLELVSPPGTGRAGGHLHRDLEQRFEVIEGQVEVRLGKEPARTLAAGESLDVPRGTPHVDPWNESGQPATWRNVIAPSSPFVRTFIATYGELLAAGELSNQETFTFLQLMAVLHAGRADSWADGAPIALQRLLIAGFAFLARLRGIQPVVPA